MLCVSARVVALLGLRRPEHRQQPQWPVRLHLCGGGCDHSARWRRIRRARGERGVGTGAPALLLEGLLAQRMVLRVCPFRRPFCPFELIFEEDGCLK